MVLAGGFLTALILYALTIVFDQTAIMLAAVPLMGVMVLNCSRNNLPRTINLKQNSPIVEQPSPISISPKIMAQWLPNHAPKRSYHHSFTRRGLRAIWECPI